MSQIDRRLSGAILVVIIAWGAFVRTWNLEQRPFWRDEAWVAQALRDLSCGQLLRHTDVPLPPLFGIAAKSVGALFGPPGLGWRLLPALFGILVLPVVYAVSRTVVAPWVAYGSVFPLVTLLLLLLVRKPVWGSRGRTTVVGLAGLTALSQAVTSVWYVVAARQASNPVLARYASHWYIDPTSLHSWTVGAAYGAGATTAQLLPFDRYCVMNTYTDVLVTGATAVLIWLIAMLGLWSWPRRGRCEMCWWVLGCWLVALAAALARIYPFGAARMLQYWAPPMIIAVAAGLICLARGLCRLVLGRSGPALAAAVLLGAVPAIWVLRQAREHRYFACHDFPRLLRVLNEKRAPGEWVLTELFAAPCVRYYAPDLPPPAVCPRTVAGTLPDPESDESELTRQVTRLAGERFWIVGASENGGADRPTLNIIRQAGYKVEVVEQRGFANSPTGAAEVLLATRYGSSSPTH